MELNASLNSLLAPIESFLEKDSQWDLSMEFQENNDPAYERIAQIFRNLFAKLEKKIEVFSQTIVNLEKITPEFKGIGKNLRSDSRILVEKLESITDILNQLYNASQLIAKNILETHTLSENIQQAVNESQNASHQAQGQIHEVFAQVEELSKTIAVLKEKSDGIETILQTISKIADVTRVLSLNASIESVKAGEKGKGFAVIAREIQNLSAQTKDATQNITQNLRQIRNQVILSSESIFSIRQNITQGKTMSEQAHLSLENVHGNQKDLSLLMKGVVKAAEEQKNKIAEVVKSSGEIREISKNHRQLSDRIQNQAELISNQADELLLEIGQFKLSIHRKMRGIVKEICATPVLRKLNRKEMESFLKQCLSQYSFFELFYVTDSKGIQVTENLSRTTMQTSYHSSGFGENWANRTWFLEVKKREKTYVSDIYRSVATNDFCFTIASPIFNEKNELSGVLGADVNFSNIFS